VNRHHRNPHAGAYVDRTDVARRLARHITLIEKTTPMFLEQPLPSFLRSTVTARASKHALSSTLTLAALCSTIATAHAQSGPVVHTALGGFILGYDIDRNGTEGILCEALTLPDGKHDVAVETFDQDTGAIIKVVRKLLHSNNDFAALGVVGNGVGLVEFEHVSNIFVDQRRYVTIDPLTANTFTGGWSPPLTVNDIIESVSVTQGLPTTAIMGFHNGGSSETFVFSTNVSANTFGPFITISDPQFAFNNSPVMAYDRVKNQAVIGASNGCPQCHPKLAFVDLATGAMTSIVADGFGFMNGVAIDPATRTLCSSTEIDANVEFLNIDTHAGFFVHIPGATSQAQSGEDVELDPIHQLFLVGQTFTSTASSGSSIQVFDEQGNYVEAINGLSLPASPARLAIRPSTRTGFVIAAPDLTSLQSFSY
jgi:hypothetical protein